MIEILEDIGYISDIMSDEEDEEKAYQGEEYLTIRDDVLVKCDESAEGHIDIPYGVRKIGEDAFYECSRVTSISIPNSVTKLGKGSFAKCGITSIILPNSVIEIGEYAFASCKSFKSITIPESVTQISATAFVGRFAHLTIKCHKGSYADKYAKENVFKVEYI